MEIMQAFKFRLKPKYRQTIKMKQFAGCCRFVWNKALSWKRDVYTETGKNISFFELCKEMTKWKNNEEIKFLNDAHSQILQTSLKDLDQAYANFFAKRADFPKFKRKGEKDSFKYPQGFKIDEGNSRIYLPKIGWVKYFKSRDIIGIPKNMTVSLECGEWFVSVQTQRDIPDPVHPSNSWVGIDMGIAHFATLSDGTFVESINVLKKYSDKLAKLQRSLARKVKFSTNWRKIKIRIGKLHRKIANIRRDFLHKLTTGISKNHAHVVVEDLKIRNMSKSARGTVENPGRNVSAKSGLNRSILDQGWGEFVRQLEYKLKWSGGELIKINPQHTSQTCSRCGFIHKDNRRTQTGFECQCCGFKANADYNAALNILAAGHAVSACGAERARASAMKQEPACGCVNF